VLTLPLRFSGEEIGRIVVFRSEGATLFTPVDEELLRSFSDQAAVAIGNALLHERLAQSERRLAGVVEHSPAGILLLDGAGRVRSANAAAESVSGRPRAELVGRLLAEALPLVDEHGRPVPSPLDGSRLAPLSRDAAVAQRSEDGGTRADGVEDAPRRHARRSARGAIARHAPRKSHTEAGGQETGSPANVPLDLRDARWVQLSVTPFDEAGASGDGFVAVVTDLTAWRDAERAKTAFLAGLSHELKTPLSLIRGFAETLGAPELDGEEREAFREHAVEVILDETAHLTRMVDQLLLAARASAGALALDLHEVDVARLAEELVGQFAQTFPALRWKLKAGEAAPIVGDPSRLRDVVANLLSNAAKYAPAATLVEVSVDAAPDGGVLLRVRDEGRGIEAANLTRVFERFWRADETVEGTGLGLYMARAIVAAHGGRIEVEHSEPGRGTTFLVRLPAAPPGGRAALRAIPDEEEESMS
jgi:PAS domain S-box-containing protein